MQDQNQTSQFERLTGQPMRNHQWLGMCRCGQSHTDPTEVQYLNSIPEAGRELVPAYPESMATTDDDCARLEENTMAWWAMSAVGWAALIKQYGWTSERQRGLDASMRDMYRARKWATYNRTGVYLPEIPK